MEIRSAFTKLVIAVSCWLFLSACKKEHVEDSFAETFPVNYEGSEWRYATPYIRAFTKDGEIKTKRAIDSLLGNSNLQLFKLQETYSSMSSSRVRMRSKDDLSIHVINYSQTSVYNNGYLISEHRERFFAFRDTLTIGHINYDMHLEQDLQKHPFPFYQTFTNPSGFTGVQYVPRFYGYRTQEALEIPHITYYKKWIGGRIIPGVLDEDFYKKLLPGETVFVQTSVLVFKRV
jgi:hypothetical protein